MTDRKPVLLLITLVAAFFTIAAAGGDHSYIGAAKCKMCHKTQFSSWENTVHAKATDDAKASTERTFSAECLQCHATNADETMAGVQCEMCHGPGSDYKKMSVMKNRDEAVAAGLVIPTQETCNRCHDGEDHRKKVVFEDQIGNKDAIHEFKNK
jgi:hypothetical protein